MLTTRPTQPPRRSAGFTVIETLTAVAITATLSAIALPSIEGQLLRMRRVDAHTTMLAVQLAEERWRSGAPAYAALADLGVRDTTPAGHYRLAVAEPSRDGYHLLASAVGAQHRDAACRWLRLVVTGADVRYASGPDEATANDEAANRRCWNR